MHSQVEHVCSVCGYACVCEHVCVAVCYQKPLPEIQNIYFLFNKFPEGEVSELLLKRGVYSEMSFSHEIGAYQDLSGQSLMVHSTIIMERGVTSL